MSFVQIVQTVVLASCNCLTRFLGEKIGEPKGERRLLTFPGAGEEQIVVSFYAFPAAVDMSFDIVWRCAERGWPIHALAGGEPTGSR